MNRCSKEVCNQGSSLEKDWAEAGSLGLREPPTYITLNLNLGLACSVMSSFCSGCWWRREGSTLPSSVRKLYMVM